MNRVWVRNLGSYNLSLGTGIRLPLASILPSLTGDRFQLDSVVNKFAFFAFVLEDLEINF